MLDDSLMPVHAVAGQTFSVIMVSSSSCYSLTKFATKNFAPVQLQMLIPNFTQWCGIHTRQGVTQPQQNPGAENINKSTSDSLKVQRSPRMRLPSAQHRGDKARPKIHASPDGISAASIPPQRRQEHFC